MCSCHDVVATIPGSIIVQCSCHQHQVVFGPLELTFHHFHFNLQLPDFGHWPLRAMAASPQHKQFSGGELPQGGAAWQHHEQHEEHPEHNHQECSHSCYSFKPLCGYRWRCQCWNSWECRTIKLYTGLLQGYPLTPGLPYCQFFIVMTHEQKEQNLVQ